MKLWAAAPNETDRFRHKHFLASFDARYAAAVVTKIGLSNQG
jgi:hypothetical protein